MARYSNGNLWRKQYARIKARHDDCGICHKAIDYSLPSGHPMGFEVDHIVPISKGGAVYDMDNLQASHRECNRIKSDHMACMGNEGECRRFTIPPKTCVRDGRMCQEVLKAVDGDD